MDTDIDSRLPMQLVEKQACYNMITKPPKPFDSTELKAKMELIMKNVCVKPDYDQVGCTLIVMGETGCGKSTQVPQIIYKYWQKKFKGYFKMVISERVASEMEDSKDLVGFAVRFNRTDTDNTKIIFETDGMLLQEIMNDPYLTKFNCVIIDEAHERSINTDLLLGYLKKLVFYRRMAGDTMGMDSVKLRLVIMTATGDTKRFCSFFPGSKCLMVKGRNFNVNINFLSNDLSEQDYLTKTMATVIRLHIDLPPHDHFLVFLTGQEEIEAAVRQLRTMNSTVPVVIYPLYAALSEISQQGAFVIPKVGIRKIVLATNIAETSLTIPGITTVIDSGYMKSKFYLTTYGLEVYQVGRISKSQAIQRAGRAGRVQEGQVYRMYTRKIFEDMVDFEEPEITRSCLTQTCLLISHLKVLDGPLKFMNRISDSAKADAKEELNALGCYNGFAITDLGRKLGRYPLEPKLAKVVLDSAYCGVLHQVCAIIAMMESQNLFCRCNDDEQAQALQKFMAPEGDLITYYNIFRQYVKSKNQKAFCETNKMNFRALQNAIKVRDQLKTTVNLHCASLGITYKPKQDDLANEAIVKCFGLNIPWNRATLDKSSKFYHLERISKRKDVQDNGSHVKPLQAKIHPSSSLVLAKPPRIFFLKITLNDAKDMFIHHCSVFDHSYEA